MKTFNVISLGAGKQSTFMLIEALKGRFGIIPDAAVFSDLGCEPSFVYQNLNRLTEYCLTHFNFKIDIVSPGNLYNNVISFVNGKQVRESTPPFFLSDGGMLQRHCTSNYKIRPIRQFLRKNRAGRKVSLWIGISYDEIERIRISDVKYISNFYPLIQNKITLNSIRDYFQYSDFIEPGKSSCIMCPFRTSSHWQIMKKNFPADFQKACDFDNAVRNYPGLKSQVFLHRSLKPLDKIDFSYKPSLFPEMIEECEGLCGL
jgi:hypothetical protein